MPKGSSDPRDYNRLVDLTFNIVAWADKKTSGLLIYAAIRSNFLKGLKNHLTYCLIAPPVVLSFNIFSVPTIQQKNSWRHLLFLLALSVYINANKITVF